MGERRVYEAKKENCELCKERLGVLLPFCRDGERTFFFLVCQECRDKVPYEVIPIKSEIGEGFFYCPNIPSDLDPSRVIIDDVGATWVKGPTVGEVVQKGFDPRRGILTRYGRKLLINRVKEKGLDSLSSEERECLRSDGIDSITMKDGTYVKL